MPFSQACSGVPLKRRAARPGRDWKVAAACVFVAFPITIFSPFILTPTACAQEESPGSAPAPSLSNAGKALGKILKTETDLTLVSVTVTDPMDRSVTGLEQENFRVFEDGAEQEIVQFMNEDIPVSIGVIFDRSGSMADKIDKSKLAAKQFFRTANPQDEFFLVDFNDRAQLATPFTLDVDALQNQLTEAVARGQTALYDGVYLGLSQMKWAHNTKKALLIISDGGDNHSRYTEEDVRRFIEEADVQIYAIGLFEPGGGPTPEEQEGPSLLHDLAEMTGGREFKVNSLGDLPDIATKISMELRNQYVIGYRPSNKGHNGKWRKIKVRLQPPKGLPPLTVYAKSGYFAPAN